MIADIEMNPDGRVKGFRLRVPYREYPDAIKTGDGRSFKKSQSIGGIDFLIKRMEELSEHFDANAVEVRDSSGQTVRSPMGEGEIRAVAETLWRMAHHKAFGYRVDSEGGIKRKQDGEGGWRMVMNGLPFTL